MDQLPPLDNTLGAAYIGMVVAAVLYGVSCSQTFYYFQHYSKKDNRGIKAIVIATMISDTIHQALISHSVYVYVITYYYKPQELGNIVWSLLVEVLFNGITALLVQSFYAVRIWKFSKKNVYITAALVVLIVAEFVSILVYAAKSIPMTKLAQLAELRPLSMVSNILTVAGDVLITVVFCILLHRARNNLQSSNTMINLLITFTVQTGMLTSLCAIASFVSTLVAPNSFAYICFYFILGRLYCNSLLATLNVRKAIRGRGHNDLGISLRQIGDSGASTEDHHKEIDIKVEIETRGYIAGVEVHGDGRVPPSARSAHNTNGSQVAETESDLESGRPRHLKRASSF